MRASYEDSEGLKQIHRGIGVHGGHWEVCCRHEDGGLGVVERDGNGEP